MHAKSLQSCPTLCDPIDSSPPGPSVPGILQARTLEWVAISFSNAWKWKMKVKSFSRIQLLATPWTAAYQAPPSMGFSRQEYWSGLPFPSPYLWIDTVKTELDCRTMSWCQNIACGVGNTLPTLHKHSWIGCTAFRKQIMFPELLKIIWAKKKLYEPITLIKFVFKQNERNCLQIKIYKIFFEEEIVPDG